MIDDPIANFMDKFTGTLAEKQEQLLSKVPASQRQAALTLIVQYGPRLFEMSIDSARDYFNRIRMGDYDAVIELDTRLSMDEFLAQVRQRTQQWAQVADYNVEYAKTQKDIALRLAPILLAILLAMLGF